MEGEPPAPSSPFVRTNDASVDTRDLTYSIPERTVHMGPSTSSPDLSRPGTTVATSPEPEREVVMSMQITARPSMPDVAPSATMEERGPCRGYQHMTNTRRPKEHEEPQDEEQRNRRELSIESARRAYLDYCNRDVEPRKPRQMTLMDQLCQKVMFPPGLLPGWSAYIDYCIGDFLTCQEAMVVFITANVSMSSKLAATVEWACKQSRLSSTRERE